MMDLSQACSGFGVWEMPTCDSRYRGRPVGVNGRDTRTDTVSQRTVWLRGPLIITDRATDRRTDRQTVPQRAQTGPGGRSRPDKYKEAKWGERGAARTEKKINPAAAARLRPADNVLLQSGMKSSPRPLRDKAMRDGDK